ncbi:LeuA family protein [Bauldia sp.]|uniref:LeuA family protein n=1 Tax=Bauldia sp. TaxID=2575872 RepID=UPI003BA94BFA
MANPNESADSEIWNQPRWATSRHNWDPAIAVPPHSVELHDLTIRDGEESADLAFTTADKVRIAEALARLGIKRTEVFLTVPGWQEVVRALLARNLGMDLWVTWQPGRVETALDLGARHVMVWYRIGEVFQQHVAKASRAELMDQMLEQVRAARAAGCVVNLFMPESTRADLEHITTAAKAAEQEGAEAVTVVDSQGIARPNAMAYLVRHLKAETGLKVEVHCHNDFGLAVANVLGGYEGGADVLQVSINGIGYRAGNAAMEAVAAALEMIYGVDTGLQLDRLPEVCRLVEEISGLPNGYFKAIVGDGAFRYEQWSATAALIAGGERPYAFPFEPEVVGRTPELVVGKWSDTGAVVQKLADYGLQATPDQVQRILVRSQRTGAAKHRPLADAEFLAIANAAGASEVEG